MSAVDHTQLAMARLRPVHRPLPFVTLRVVAALILREMTSTYGRKPGGYLWAVLEPIAGITVMAYIFSYGFRHPRLGTDFSMYYASGVMPFWLFKTVSAKTAQSLRYSRALLAYPRVTILDAMLARYLLNVFLMLLVACIVLSGVRSFNDTGTTVILPRIILGFAMMAAVAAGVGALNCVLMTAFPLYQTAWGVLTTPLLIVSGVIILLEDVPRPYRDWLAWNPLVHAIAEVRSGFYYGYTPDYVSPAYVFGVSLVLLGAGLLFTWRFYRQALEA